MRNRGLFHQLRLLELTGPQRKEYPGVQVAARLAKGISRKLKPTLPLWSELPQVEKTITQLEGSEIGNIRAHFKIGEVPASKIRQVQGKPSFARHFEARLKAITGASSTPAKAKPKRIR
jgi:hypothetical protein